MQQAFEFEQPAVELAENVRKLKAFIAAKDIEVHDAVDVLEELLPQVRTALFEKLSPWEKVQLARHPKRPYPQYYIQTIFTDFLELCGDRHDADDKTIVGGFARLDGEEVMVIGTRKGTDLKENMLYNFGCANPEGFRKALRLMALADKAQLPIITFVDTPGAYPGISSEEHNVSEAIAVNLREMFRFTVPIICVVTGEGGSGGALSIAVGNSVLMQQYAYYSVITPEGCAAILWRSADESPRAAAALHLTSDELLKLNVIDEVIMEPPGGAHTAPAEAADILKRRIISHLNLLRNLRPEELKAHRYRRFRAIGQFLENNEKL